MSAPQPMLSTAIRSWPDGGEWVLEPKFDGFRVLIEVLDDAGARAWSRRGTSLTEPVRGLLPAFADVPAGTIFDGELVALGDHDGRVVQDFATVCRAVLNNDRAAALGLHYVAFDLLARGRSTERRDLRGHSWRERVASARTRQLCSQCGRMALAQARVDDQVICGSCDKRWQNSKARCSACGATRRPARGQAHAGLCELYAGVTNSQVCGRCGAEAKLYAAARCTDCYLHDEIDRMRASGDPTAVRQLDTYLQSLAQARPANSVLDWLRISRTSAAPVLRELVVGIRPLTHEALDELSESHAIAFLRAALVQHRALPERDELVHRFELWIEQITNGLSDHPDRTAVRRWATWMVLHDLRTGGARPPSRSATSTPAPSFALPPTFSPGSTSKN